jgi:enamine deaminase RidA (YjgF/YER057c/UK114 family)
VGEDVSEEQAVEAARLACLNAIAAVGSVLSSVDSIRRIVRVNGFVSSAPGYTNQPTVLNGASDFLLDLFGENGKHSRVAIGVAELPRNAPVEVDLVVEVDD